MTPQSSRSAANLVMALTAGAAVYVVLRTPALRSAAWKALRTGLTVTLPGYLAHEVQAAWAASAESP